MQKNFFMDGNVQREIVTMRVEPHEGNEAGLVTVYRDEAPEGAVIVEDEVEGAPAETAKERKARLKAEKEAADAAKVVGN